MFKQTLSLRQFMIDIFLSTRHFSVWKYFDIVRFLLCYSRELRYSFFKPFLFFYLMEPTVESYSVKWQQFRASTVSSTLQLVINQGRKLQQGATQDYQNLLSDDVLYLAISKLTLGSRDVQIWNYFKLHLNFCSFCGLNLPRNIYPSKIITGKGIFGYFFH